MVIIFALLGLWAIFGVGGLLVGLLIGILSAIIKYGNSEEESYLTKQDRQADPKNQTHETCQQERLIMEKLTPFIDVVCYFALKYEPNWHKEKVSFVKQIFINAADGDHDEILYLRERMKLRNRPCFEQSMAEINKIFQSEELEFKQFILEKILILLVNTCNEFEAIRTDAVMFAKMAGMSYLEYTPLIESYVRDYEQSKQQKQHLHQSELEKYAEILGISPNATEAEIKQAYRQKIKDFHPDRNINVTSAVEEIIRKETQKLNAAKDYLLKNIKFN